MEHHDGFHIDEPLCRSQLLQLLTFLRGNGDGLFAEDVLPGIQKELRLHIMKAVGACHIDGFDGRVSRQLLYGGVNGGYPVIAPKLKPFFPAPGADGGKLPLAGKGGALYVRIDNPAGSDHGIMHGDPPLLQKIPSL